MPAAPRQIGLERQGEANHQYDQATHEERHGQRLDLVPDLQDNLRNRHLGRVRSFQDEGVAAGVVHLDRSSVDFPGAQAGVQRHSPLQIG